MAPIKEHSPLAIRTDITPEMLDRYINLQAHSKGIPTNAPIFEAIRNHVKLGPFNVDPDHIIYKTLWQNDHTHPFYQSLQAQAKEIIDIAYSLRYTTNGAYVPLNRDNKPGVNSFTTYAFMGINGTAQVLGTLSSSVSGNLSNLSMYKYFRPDQSYGYSWDNYFKALGCNGFTGVELGGLGLTEKLDIKNIKNMPENGVPKSEMASVLKSEMASVPKSEMASVLKSEMVNRMLRDNIHFARQNTTPPIHFGCIMAPNVARFVSSSGIHMDHLSGTQLDENNPDVLELSRSFPRYWTDGPPRLYKIDQNVSPFDAKIQGTVYTFGKPKH